MRESAQQRRDRYRIHYPRVVRPVLCVGDTWHAVVDLSEDGACVQWASDDLPQPSQPIAGDIVFHDSATLWVLGAVLRCYRRTIAVRFTHGISMQRIVQEQLMIARKFPRVKTGG